MTSEEAAKKEKHIRKCLKKGVYVYKSERGEDQKANARGEAVSTENRKEPQAEKQTYRDNISGDSDNSLSYKAAQHCSLSLLQIWDEG